MKTYTVTGGGGLRLHVQETGNPNGRPILFIHGFSQCRLAWNKQMHSDLAKDFRLVAMDIRGHGLSEKPRDVYGDSKLWADDVNESLALPKSPRTAQRSKKFWKCRPRPTLRACRVREAMCRCRV